MTADYVDRSHSNRLSHRDTMKIASYEHDSGHTAIRIKHDDGILPRGHSDLTALIKAGPRELDLIRRAVNAQASWCIRGSSARRDQAPPRPVPWLGTGEGNRQMMSGLTLSDSRDSVGFAARLVAALTARELAGPRLDLRTGWP